MTSSPVTGLLLLAASSSLGGSSSLAPPPTPADADAIELAQLTFHSRVVIRVETARAPVKVREPYREKKGPDCVGMTDILGAAVLAPGSVDLVTRGGGRLRVRFDASCPALDFYSGFYIVPHRDGRICANRDFVRDRAGGECEIEKIRKLVPRK